VKERVYAASLVVIDAGQPVERPGGIEQRDAAARDDTFLDSGARSMCKTSFQFFRAML
jgi:hypothetical protein